MRQVQEFVELLLEAFHAPFQVRRVVPIRTRAVEVFLQTLRILPGAIRLPNAKLDLATTKPGSLDHQRIRGFPSWFGSSAPPLGITSVPQLLGKAREIASKIFDAPR